jgi:hypothetical protein
MTPSKAKVKIAVAHRKNRSGCGGSPLPANRAP